MATAKQTPEFTLQIRRTFAASREKVFAAWAEREQLEKWMCKDVASQVVIHHLQDIRPGGRYLMEVRDAGKKETYWGQGVYREVKPPERLVFTWAWTKDRPDGEPVHPGREETEVTVEFLARGNSTEVVLTHVGFAGEKVRADHDLGWNGCFDVLAYVVEASRSPE